MTGVQPASIRRPRYSVLYNGFDLESEFQNISSMLHEGIKVLWFGTSDDLKVLRMAFKDFAECRLLQAYETACDRRFSIVDGDIEGAEDGFASISRTEGFDSEQYQVEHSRDENMIVEASAGTGKTTVMIDRVLFLFHMMDDLDPSEITMITFTNEASNQMRRKLQSAILERYGLTGNPRYLEMLEKQSQIQISTIHSFAFNLIRKLGAELGLSKDVKARSLKYETDRQIDDIIDGQCTWSRVEDQLGMPFYQTRKLVDEYWKKMLQLGLSDEEIAGLDWGDAVRGSEVMQHTLERTIAELPARYSRLKKDKDAVSVNDMMRDLDEIVERAGNLGDYVRIRFLFIDEFQDSDDSQIRMALRLKEALGLSLFVVGDIKQSIYRFRGADDSAFEQLKEGLRECGESVEVYQLRTNYRTCRNVVKDLDVAFTKWGEDGVLNYSGRSIANVAADGTFDVKCTSMNKSLKTDLKTAVKDLKSRLPDGSEYESKDRVVVLARKNYQLSKIEEICNENGIPVVVKQGGEFYLSDAVRDFFSALSSFVFHDSIHYFNYLVSPYSSCKKLPETSKLESMSGVKSTLDSYFENILTGTSWGYYDSELRKRPAVSVLTEMIEKEPVIDNYISIAKFEYTKKGNWDEEDLNDQVHAKAVQYRADLNKLIEILHTNFRSNASSLYEVYEFLNRKIMTDRTEESAEADENYGPGCVYCMTVHQAKGLEFDTVFIPITSNSIKNKEDEILIDKKSGAIGWMCTTPSNKVMKNDFYDPMHDDEIQNEMREETRILYVAMTRAIRNLTVYIDNNPPKNSWGSLLREEADR